MKDKPTKRRGGHSTPSQCSVSPNSPYIDSIASFEAERAGIFACFGARLTFERYYTAYLKHCEKRSFVPVSAEAFIPVSNRMISELREWWYQKDTGIYVIEK